MPVHVIPLSLQPNANDDDADEKHPCHREGEERGELIWRHVGHGLDDRRALVEN
jgi:hypothetical protein